MAGNSDYVVAAFSLLCQFASTVLIIQHGEWGKRFSSSIQWQIIAAATGVYFFVLFSVFVLRSAIGGNRIPSFCRAIALPFQGCVIFLIYAGIRERTIQRLLVSALIPLAIFSLVDLLRTVGLFLTVSAVVVPLFSDIWYTEGYLWLRIAFGILLFVIVPIFMDFRERRWISARTEAEAKKD